MRCDAGVEERGGGAGSVRTAPWSQSAKELSSRRRRSCNLALVMCVDEAALQHSRKATARARMSPDRQSPGTAETNSKRNNDVAAQFTDRLIRNKKFTCGCPGRASFLLRCNIAD